ncbi:hypothetical protein [Azovibrio restrictus]|uniref:hypothetical protein n=1 Tax=Azovibrio restrictus TaxID=146938 RepID=UPI0026F200A0|nr:hypothetical protein [Azovibrio restrictus]MDD3481563.1 hypothetical protein [Azovibrio restrictus]
MTFLQSVPRRLWPILLQALALVALGIGPACWGWQEASRAAQARDQSRDKLEQIRQRLEQARAEAAELQQAGQRLQALQAQGLFTRENRLEWVELLRQTRDHLAIPAMQYEFQPQHPLEDGQGQFLVSPMQLQLGLNHELELPPFLHSLSSHSRALVLARECELQRNPGRPQPPEPGPNILVRCKLDWITGQLPGDQSP